MVINLQKKVCAYNETIISYFRDVKTIKMLSKEEEKSMLERMYQIKKKYDKIRSSYFNEHKFQPTNEEVKRIGKQKYGIDINELESIRNNIVLSNQRFVISAARAMGNESNIEDLIDEGNLALFEAIDNFNPLEYTNSFITFAVHYIRRNLNLYLAKTDGIIRKSNITKTYSTLAKATDMFVQEYHRNPSTEEIKEYLYEKMGIEVKNIDVINMQVSSIDAMSSSDDDENRTSGESRNYNSHTASFNSYEEEAEQQANQRIVGLMMNKLKPREREIISMSFGIGVDREYKLQEIAEKLNLTTERVRQMKNEILRKLKNEKVRI